ncbi:MAG: mechanosensitive ion channel [Candidatus Omnitrophota bacterium]|nr:mechanosensitive ion channel [Candidatus Omnitrophota bacterium]
MSAVAGELFQQAVQFVPRLIAGAWVVALFWVASRIARVLFQRLARRRGEQHQILMLLRRIVGIAIVLLGCVTALGTVGVNVSALVAGLGLTGFALGFALQDAISNLLSGILLMLYRPFRLGDHVAVAGMEGVVADVNLRYTTLERQQKQFLIPNALLFTNTVIRLMDHGGRPEARRVSREDVVLSV